MDFIEVVRKKVAGDLEDFLLADEGAVLVLEGAVHSVRDMGEIAFVVLRRREGLIQTVLEKGTTGIELSEIREGDFVRVTEIGRAHV